MDKSTTQLLQIISSTSDITDFLDSNDFEFINENFTDMLTFYLERSGMTKYQVLNASEIHTNYGYQIFNGRRKPTRDKVLQLALGLGLSLKELQMLLLSLNERQLYIRNRRDSIIMYALEQKLAVLDLEQLLIDYEEEILIK